MVSIIPDLGAGAVPFDTPDVAGVFTLPPNFSTTCDYLALPSDCFARIMPSQINAIVSEMLALMAEFNQDGEFDCERLDNMAANFQVYVAEVAGDISDLDSRVAVLEGSGPVGLKSAYATEVTGSQNVAQDANARINSWLSPVVNGVAYSSGVFTCQDAGLWSVTAFISTGVSTIREVVSLYLNGTVVARNGSRSDTNKNHSADSIAWNGVMQVGDTLEVRYDVTAASGGSINVNIGNFCMAKLGNI